MKSIYEYQVLDKETHKELINYIKATSSLQKYFKIDFIPKIYHNMCILNKK